jgi:hypothetical protein
LKKELADISMALNLEAQKAKSDMNDFLKYYSDLLLSIQLKDCLFYSIVDRDRNQTIKYDLEQEQRLK